ncbi:MAG TPA: septum formation initiator family protein [Caldilineaceae bacterium]|nr:septum formation initiator family protein [Caldilineaceae bacterium]
MHPSRRPRVLLFLLITLCGFFVYSYTGRQAERDAIAAQIAATRAEIAAAKVENQRLKAEYAYVTSPAYLEEVARNDLGFAKEGDRVIIIVEEDDPAAVSRPSSSATAPPPPGDGTAPAVHPTLDPQALPIWQQWLTFFTQERATAP